MADAKVDVVISAETGAAEKGLSGLKKGLSGLGDTAKVAIGVTMANAFSAIPGLIDSAADALGEWVTGAAKTDQVSKTFDTLTESIGTTSDALLTDMTAATRGMVGDADLMAAANKFVAMGLADTADEAVSMAEMATQLGLAMGTGPTQAMEDFALMLANQSIERLDTFAISSGQARARIEEMTAATEGMTREQAFTAVVMEMGAEAMAKVGEQGEGTMGTMARWEATTANLKDTVGTALLPALEGILGWASTLLEEYGPAIAEWAASASAWLGEMIPRAIEGLSTAWTTVLEPALTALAVIWTDTIQPALAAAWSFIQENLEPVLIALAAVILTVVVPAFVAWAASTIAALAPILLPIAAIAAAVYLLYEAWESNFLGIRDIADTVVAWFEANVIPMFENVVAWVEANWPKVQEVVEAVMAAIQEAVSFVLGLIKGWWEEHGSSIQTIAETAWAAIQTAIETVLGVIETVVSTVLGGIKTFWDTWGGEIIALTSTAWDAIKVAIETVLDVIGGVVDAFAALLTGDWQGFLDELEGAWSSLWEGVETILDDAKDIILGVWDILLTEAENIWQDIKDWIEDRLGEIWDEIKFIFDEINAKIHAVMDDVWAKIEAAFIGIVGAVEEAKRILEPIVNAIAGFFGNIGGAIEGVLGFISDLKGKIEGLKNIQLPSWLPGASPPPMATWFMEIGDAAGYATGALNALVGIGLPGLGEYQPSPVGIGLPELGEYQPSPVGIGLPEFIQNIGDAVSYLSEQVDELDSEKLFDLGGDLSSAGGGFGRLLSDEMDASAARIEEINALLEEGVDDYLTMKHLEYERTALLGERADQEEKLLALQQAQADLDFLQQQLDVLELLSEYGLDAGEVLGGMTLGLEASAEDLVDAMTVAMQAVIAAAEDELQIASPSQVFAEMAENVISSFAGRMRDLVTVPALAAREMAIGAVAGAGGALMPSSSTATHHHWNLTVHSQARSEDVRASYRMMRAMAGV